MGLEGQLVLGRYRVFRALAQCGASQVYLGRDEHRDGLSANVLIRHYTDALGQRAATLPENVYKRLNELTHIRQPGIVALLDFGQVDGKLAVVSSHSTGLPLSALGNSAPLENVVLSASVAAGLVCSLCETLVEAKSRFGPVGLHGRISLDAIYVAKGRRPQLMDFAGGAIEDAAAEGEAPASCLLDTLSHAAPEVARGEPRTEASEVYALTLVLYRLLCGSNPFLGRSVPETLQRVMKLQPARLSLPSLDNSEELNSLLTRGLSKLPDQRFSGFEELLAALEQLFPECRKQALQGLNVQLESKSWGDWQTAAIDESGTKTQLRVPSPGPRSRNGKPVGLVIDSGFPAFAAGLLTEQPRSVTEHTHARARQLPSFRRWRSTLTIVVPAAALLMGLVLGRISPGGVPTPQSMNPKVQEALAPSNFAARPSLVHLEKPIERLHREAENCARRFSQPSEPVEIHFRLEPSGYVKGVQITPLEQTETGLGSCLLRAAWQVGLRLPGATSLVVPVPRSALP